MPAVLISGWFASLTTLGCSAIRDLTRAKTAHDQEAHAFSHFPLGSVEAAVAAVPTSQYPAHEQRLTSFGPAYVYW